MIFARKILFHGIRKWRMVMDAISLHVVHDLHKKYLQTLCDISRVSLYLKMERKSVSETFRGRT